MRSPTSLLVLVLSFISFAVSGPSHSTTHSSRLAKNPISSRQFHYPRTLVDVCADVDLSLLLDDVLGLKLGSLLGDICLCLSAFPLDLDLYADLQLLVSLLGETKVETLLQTFVEDNGAQCTYPDHASSKCTSGNPCGFTCTDGFVEDGGGCVCSLPNSVCNGICGSYPNGCSSALPRAPKMARRSITSSPKRGTPAHHSGSPLNLDVDAGLILGGSNPSHDSPSLDLGGLLNGLLSSPGTTSGGGSGTDLDIDELVDELLNSLGINRPVSGGNQSSGLEATLDICIGADLSGTQNLLDTVTDIVNSLLSSLLGTAVKCEVGSSCPALVDPNTISVDLQLCGLSDGSLGSTLDKTLKAVDDSLNGSLGGVTIITKCNAGGSECPATPTSSNSNHSRPSPSNSHVPPEIPQPSIYPSHSSTPHSDTDLSGLVNSTSGQIGGILDYLGLSLGDYNLDTDADLVVGVFVGLSDTLSSTDGLVDTVTALVDEILDSLLGTDVITQPNPNPASSPTPPYPDQGDGIVVDVDLSAVLNATLSDTGDLVDGVLSAVSGALAYLLNLDVVVNADGGHDCGCSGSRKASAKN